MRADNWIVERRSIAWRWGIVTEDEVKSLTALWRARWGGAPIGCALSARHPDRWVRFHSLPDSKRYAETEQEYEVILDRHHRVLAELGADKGP